MTDSVLDGCCLSLHKGDDEHLWYRKVPDNLPLVGKLRITVKAIPDLENRNSFLGWNHYLEFIVGTSKVSSRSFQDIEEIKDQVFEFDLDGKSHFLKIGAYTSIWVPCLPDLLNGTLEIPIHTLVSGNGVECQMYYKHRFHRLLDDSLRLKVEFQEAHGEQDLGEPMDGVMREHTQHPLNAWHRGAYDAVLYAWLSNYTRWSNNYIWDLGIFICNEHLLLGMFYAHHWNPFTHRARFIVYIVSLLMNVFALGLSYYTSCLIPECPHDAVSQNYCFENDPGINGFHKCNDGGTELYCEVDKCATLTFQEEYSYIALGALIAFVITKSLIFFAECRCAKAMDKSSRFRKCLEESGHGMMIIGVLCSVFLVAMGMYFTLDSVQTNGEPSASTWWWNFAFQMLQSSIYDLIFCILLFQKRHMCQTYEKLEFFEDDEYFSQHKEKKSIFIQTLGAEKRIDSLGAEKNTDTQIQMDQKGGGPLESEKNSSMRRQWVKNGMMKQSMNKLVGDNIGNEAEKPVMKKFNDSKDAMKKMKVKVPAQAKPGGLLKVRTPEGMSLLIRLTADVKPGISELIVEYAIRQCAKDQKKETA